MSVSALTVINEAAALVGDPNFTRVNQPAWNVILNSSARDLMRKLRLQLWTVTFDLAALDHEYALPSDCLQVKWVQVNETPSDQTQWREVKEFFEDEYRAATNGQYSSGTRPTRYFVLNDTFHLHPMPDTTILAGGKILYWGLPDDVTSPSTQGIPVMDILRDTLRERMLIYGWRRLKDFEAAAQAEKEWEASLTVDRDRLEDRSADRRPRVRTRPGNIFGQR